MLPGCCALWAEQWCAPCLTGSRPSVRPFMRTCPDMAVPTPPKQQHLKRAGRRLSNGNGLNLRRGWESEGEMHRKEKKGNKRKMDPDTGDDTSTKCHCTRSGQRPENRNAHQTQTDWDYERKKRPSRLKIQVASPAQEKARRDREERFHTEAPVSPSDEGIM